MRWRFLVICFIVSSICWASRHFYGDDALIYARYVRNALHGLGLVFNPGERVNALTSPFFTALLLVASWMLRGHILLAEFILGGGCFIAACVVMERLVPWSGLVIAATWYFYLCLGMETPLFLLMLSLLTLAYKEERLNWIPMLALLTVLTRFEGMALVVVVGLRLVQEHRRPALFSYVAPAFILASYLVFNRAFYGKWLPSSATAKFEQAFSGYWGHWPHAFLHLGQMLSIFMPIIYVVPLGLILAVRGASQEGSSRMNRVLLPFCFALGAFYILCNIPNYHWYYAPFVFFIATYAVRGVPGKPWAYALLMLVIVDCFGTAIYKMGQNKVDADYAAMGTWIRDHTKPDAKIAAIEIGALGWYDERYMDDVMGLTNPPNARRIFHHDLRSWLQDQQPDYVVVVKPASFGQIAAAESPAYAYVPIRFGRLFLMKRKDSTR